MVRQGGNKFWNALYTGYLALHINVSPIQNDLFRHSEEGDCVYQRDAVSLHFARRDVINEVECVMSIYKEMMKQDPDAVVL